MDSRNRDDSDRPSGMVAVRIAARPIPPSRRHAVVIGNREVFAPLCHDDDGNSVGGRFDLAARHFATNLAKSTCLHDANRRALVALHFRGKESSLASHSARVALAIEHGIGANCRAEQLMNKVLRDFLWPWCFSRVHALELRFPLLCSRADQSPQNRISPIAVPPPGAATCPSQVNQRRGTRNFTLGWPTKIHEEP